MEVNPRSDIFFGQRFCLKEHKYLLNNSAMANEALKTFLLLLLLLLLLFGCC